MSGPGGQFVLGTSRRGGGRGKRKGGGKGGGKGGEGGSAPSYVPEWSAEEETKLGALVEELGDKGYG